MKNVYIQWDMCVNIFYMDPMGKRTVAIIKAVFDVKIKENVQGKSDQTLWSVKLRRVCDPKDPIAQRKDG